MRKSLLAIRLLMDHEKDIRQGYLFIMCKDRNIFKGAYPCCGRGYMTLIVIDGLYHNPIASLGNVPEQSTFTGD